MNKAKEIILEQLKEQGHPERVEDVIFWALDAYWRAAGEATWGKAIAYAIVQQIKEEEKAMKEESERKPENNTQLW